MIGLFQKYPSGTRPDTGQNILLRHDWATKSQARHIIPVFEKSPGMTAHRRPEPKRLHRAPYSTNQPIPAENSDFARVYRKWRGQTGEISGPE
jgi:hypothetical protein